jgi:endonuclease I
MRAIVVLFSLLLVGVLDAQIPEGYYASAETKSGDALKNALYQIIKGHIEYSYSSSSTDTWDILKEADQDPANTKNVILFYTNRSVNAAQEYANGSGWNREHIWAKSRGDFGTLRGAGTDCHHLRACDISVNSTRNNRFFGEGGYEVQDEGQYIGCFVGQSTYTFEPRDDIKGDVARMIFYMAVRYEGDNGEPDLELSDQILDKYSKLPLHGIKETLLSWHVKDGVDDKERQRNNVIFKYQKNRNPFIDHPEFAGYIWGAANDVQWTREDAFTVTGNDQFIVIECSQLVQQVDLFALSGQLIKRMNTSGIRVQIPVSNLASGIYLVKINNKEVRKVYVK